MIKKLLSVINAMILIFMKDLLGLAQNVLGNLRKIL